MSQSLIAALQNPALYPHPVESFQVLETHISWVILTGSFAYKIKKPVNFGFVNFTELEGRKHFCELELQLNQRLTHDLYLQVLPITGTSDAPQLNGTGPAIEYALQMNQFSQEQLLVNLLEQGELKPEYIDSTARQIADFHLQTPAVPVHLPYGTPEHVMAPVQQNFDQIRPMLSDDKDLQQLAALERWAQDSYRQLESVLSARKANGFIRECHGDIHLANMALFHDQVVIFDCIEFNEDFRLTDVAADVAFLAMDLQARGLHALCNRFINLYLERTGDYQILAVLPFYMAYRAMVRAKVSLFGMTPQTTPEQRAAIFQQYRNYATLAQQHSVTPKRFLSIMHGISGSGKSHTAMQLAEATGAIRLRSDIERKRLYARSDDTVAAFNHGIYDPRTNAATYERLHQLAADILQTGFPVIIDATYLKQTQRQAAQQTALAADVPFHIIDCQAPDDVLQARLQQRQETSAEPSDANWEIAQAQQANQEPLSAEELKQAIPVQANGYEENIRSLLKAFA